jgi:hypothetical protein
MKLERLEEMAEEVYGQGSAISLDKEKDGWYARVWDRAGEVVLWAWSKTSMTEARDELGKRLEGETE